jgi:DNA modification methylase
VIFLKDLVNQILEGNALDILKTFPSNFIDCVITSPPYYKIRDYQVDGQLGQENTVWEYISQLIKVFSEIRRILKDTGACWVNIGDSYNERKSLRLIPQRFAIAMTDNGWICRNEIIWHKPNVMPTSIKDRFTLDFEPFYFFTKARKYYFNTQYEDLKTEISAKTSLIKFGGNKADGYGNPTYSSNNWNSCRRVRPLSERDRQNAMKLGWDGISPYDKWYFNERPKKGYHNHEHDSEQGFVHQSRGANTKIPLVYPYGSIKRAVWKISTAKCKEAHFAVFPEKLVETPLLATCPPNGGIVLDPFVGAGTVPIVALKNMRRFIGIDLNSDYCNLARQKLEPYLQQTKILVGSFQRCNA